MAYRKARHWTYLWRRNLRDLNRYKETLKGVAGTTGVLKYQPGCCSCCVSAVWAQGKMTVLSTLVSLLWWRISIPYLLSVFMPFTHRLHIPPSLLSWQPHSSTLNYNIKTREISLYMHTCVWGQRTLKNMYETSKHEQDYIWLPLQGCKNVWYFNPQIINPLT